MKLEYHPDMTVSRFSRFSAQVIPVVASFQEPATLEDIFEEVNRRNKPKPEDWRFWNGVAEKLDMAVMRGYVREHHGLYSVVRPFRDLPSVDHNGNSRGC
ncbi:GL20346 [Drosophila persimilis]|uniref:GL20346 n=1 Tax=Drosophila persimilis TaxID=7234 RepID=B4GXT4_DROPE|nr:GL20346 [Drosophila persimilis]